MCPPPLRPAPPGQGRPTARGRGTTAPHDPATAQDRAPHAVPRTLLTLAVVLVLLAITAWSPGQRTDGPPQPLAAARQAWDHGAIAGRELPTRDAGPRAMSRFFTSLSSAERHRLADRHPLIVGNLDGAPVTLRYQANRAALADARAVADRRHHSDRLTGQGRREAGRLAHRFSSLLADGRRILAFDPTGYGRAVEVFGDLRHARRVSVVVPGVDTGLLTFERTSRRYSAPVGMARSLQTAQRAAAPEARTATVAWADYHAPQGLGLDAASSGRAADGAERLVDFVDALPGRARVTLVCHSYGSVVCGMAAGALPRRVTDIAVAGSPGMRADDVDGLDTSARVWAMRGADDWVADVPHLQLGVLGLGADPVSPGFGARRLSAGEASGHAGYFVPGTASLRNLAEVGVGGTGVAECTAEGSSGTASRGSGADGPAGDERA